MNARKNSVFAEALVGVFLTAVILLLGYFTIVISGSDILRGEKKVTVRVAFDAVGGLKSHDSVMYRGTKVGTVEDVAVTPTNLIVTAAVDRNVTLRAGCRVAVCNLSMLGGNYLLLEEGAGEPIVLGEGVLAGETPTDWMRDVASVAKNLNAITQLGEIKAIVTNVAQAAEKANDFMTRVDRMAGDIEAVVSRISRGEGLVGRLVSSDDTLYIDITNLVADLRATAADAKAISARLNRAQTFDDLEAGVTAFRTAAEGLDARPVIEKAQTLLDNLNVVATRLKEGKGTLGKLLADEGLYDQVNDAVRDMRQVLDNYRDTTPISTFSSLATGAL